MLNQVVAQEVLNTALSAGGDFAEVFLEDRRDHVLVLQNNRLETVNSGRIHGAGIRVYVGLNAIYTYTNDTNREGLLRCARQAASAVKENGAVLKARPFYVPQITNVHVIRIAPSEAEAKKKAEILRAANASARDFSQEISQVVCTYKDSEQDVLICNSEGLFTTDRRTYTRLFCQVVASSGMENQTASAGPGAMMGYELFEERVNPAQAARNAAETAVRMLHAPQCPSGVMPVAIGNGFGGVIFHEACGHSLEATSVAFGMSEFSGKLGEQIAASCVTAIDDGTMPNEWGSEHVDDEGTPTNRLVLIENGVLKNYMIDRLNGRRMEMAPTGSARRQSYAFAPTSRMRNTYIVPGNDDDHEIISTMGDGLYAAKMGGGSVNPATGEFNFAVQEGYLVRDGKITTPVRGASLIGKGADVLMKIDRVGKDMRMEQGMCGSLSGSVPTNVGQPMIRVSSMTVGGRA